MSDKLKLDPEDYHFVKQTYLYLHDSLEAEVNPFADRRWVNDFLESVKKGQVQSPEVIAQETKSPEYREIMREQKETHIQELIEKASVCTHCHLGNQRKKFVRFGGRLSDPLFIVLEQPEFYDQVLGAYLSGKGGEMIRKMIQAIGLRFEDCYFTAAIKCAGASEMSASDLEEVKVCSTYIKKEQEIIQAKRGLLFGEKAWSLLFDREGFKRSLGQWHSYEGCELLILPSAGDMLSDPALKRQVWEWLKPNIEKLKST